MNRALINFILIAISVIAILSASAAAGWHFRGLQCASDMARFKDEISTKAQKQRADTKLIEAKQEAATDQSTQRLDVQQAEQQKETVYVEKQVIQYRDRWRDRTCQRPADWVQLYNASLFGSGAAMPATSPTGSAPAGTGL